MTIFELPSESPEYSQGGVVSERDDHPRRRRVRILLVDDHELVRTALAYLIGRFGYEVVGQASDSADAVTLWRQLRPDVTLLDLHMPGLDGIATTHAIRAIDADARIVVLSTFDWEELARRALGAGACGYLLKRVSPEVLCNCIDTVHSGGRFVMPELAQRLAISPAQPTPTERELEVLTGVSQGLCNKRIGRMLGIEEGTVKAHLKSILRKLEASSRTQAASIAIRRGLVQL